MLIPANSIATTINAENFSYFAPFLVTGYAGSEVLENFPVLVRIAEDSPTAFLYSDCAPDGSDLRFADSSGNLIPHEIDTWNTEGESLIWVRVPVLSNSETIRMYYGSIAPTAMSAEDVWSRYAVVIHGGDSVTNSVAGGVAVSAGSTAVTANADAGKVGGGIRKDTNNAIGVNVAMGKPAALADTGKFSVSGWFKRNGNGNSGTHILSASRSAWGTDDGFLCLQEKGNYIDVAAKSAHQWTSGTYKLADQTWGHVAFSYEKDVAIKSYFNGNADQTKTSPGNLVSSIDTWTFGSYANKASNDSFKGDMDELRIFDGVASGDWITAEHDTMASPSFLTAGQATPCEATPAPHVGVIASDVQYTNVTLAITIGSLGKNDAMTADASWVDATLLVAADDTFASPLFSTTLARTNEVPATFYVALPSLVTNTTYYAKVVSSNSFNVAGESGAASFTTHSPGFAAGTALLVDRGFTTLSVAGTATSFGTGAEAATMRLEVSTDGFATFVAGQEVPATLGSAGIVNVSNLVSGTAYALRVRIRNDWGLDAFVALPDTETRSAPFGTSGFGWAFSQDGSTIDITFGVLGVYDGAAGTATLTYNGIAQGEKAVTAAGTLTWPAIQAVSGSAIATVVLSATLDNVPYEQTFTATIAPGSTAVSVSDVTAHMTVATSVRVHSRDVVTLPELIGTDEYILGNKLFGALSGNVLTALRPGILGIRCVTSGGATTNTLAVIILPDKIGDGDVYIYKESAVGTGNGLWHNAAYWEKVGSETNDSYPHNPDDIAIIPFYELGGNKSINLGADVSLGALFFGFFRDVDDGATANLGTNNSQYKRHIAFNRTDGKPALVQLCSNSSASNRRVTLSFSNATSVSYESDVVVNGGWDGTDAYITQGRITYADNMTNAIPEGVTLTFTEFDTQGTPNGQTFKLRNIVGGGTIWNRSAANIKIEGTDSLADFTGTLRDSGCGNHDCGRSGPIFVRTPSATNTLYELVGVVAKNESGRPQQESTSSVGRFYTGWEPGYGSTYYGETNWFPGRGLVMHGGTHYSRATENSTWGVGERERKVGAKLTLADGFNYLYETSRDQTLGHPINWLEYNALEHANKATLMVWDPTRQNAPVQASTNNVTIFHGWDAYAVGPAGDCTSSAQHPVIPWIAGPRNNQGSGWNNWAFGSFDETDRLVQPTIAAPSSLTDETAANANVELSGNDLAISSDVTVNSFILSNQGNKSKLLGEGRTLMVSSGGLIMHAAGTSIGEDGNTANGSLVLGDAAHPAYVWAKGEDASSPNQIWTPVTAPGGFVAAYTGFLTLGGNQTGIDGELVVNAGTLTLGSAVSDCTLKRNLPIRIYANATLSLPNASSARSAILKFDGAAGWFGKVEVPEGVAAKCRMADWRDYPESIEWQPLAAGTYAGDEDVAAARGCFFRPDIISGMGTLEVMRDGKNNPMMIILR